MALLFRRLALIIGYLDFLLWPRLWHGTKFVAQVAYFVAIRVDSSNVRLLHVRPDVIIFHIFFFFAFFPCFTLSTIFEAYTSLYRTFPRGCFRPDVGRKGSIKKFAIHRILSVFFRNEVRAHTDKQDSRSATCIYIHTHINTHLNRS